MPKKKDKEGRASTQQRQQQQGGDDDQAQGMRQQQQQQQSTPEQEGASLLAEATEKDHEQGQQQEFQQQMLGLERRHQEFQQRMLERLGVMAKRMEKQQKLMQQQQQQQQQKHHQRCPAEWLARGWRCPFCNPLQAEEGQEPEEEQEGVPSNLLELLATGALDEVELEEDEAGELPLTSSESATHSEEDEQEQAPELREQAQEQEQPQESARASMSLEFIYEKVDWTDPESEGKEPQQSEESEFAATESEDPEGEPFWLKGGWGQPQDIAKDLRGRGWSEESVADLLPGLERYRAAGTKPPRWMWDLLAPLPCPGDESDDNDDDDEDVAEVQELQEQQQQQQQQQQKRSIAGKKSRRELHDDEKEQRGQEQEQELEQTPIRSCRLQDLDLLAMLSTPPQVLMTPPKTKRAPQGKGVAREAPCRASEGAEKQQHDPCGPGAPGRGI